MRTLAVLTALACVAASCVTEAGDCPEEPETPKEVFQLRFRICSHISESDSRAENDEEDGSGAENDSYTIEDGSVAENMINVKDIVYYIFDRDRKFLLQLKPETTVTTILNASYAIYEVTAKIGNDEDPSNYFKSRWNTQIDFYILAMANYSGYTTTMPTPSSDTTIESLMNGNTTVMVGLPDTEKILEGAEGISADGKSLIPMAGLQLFSVSGRWFKTQNGEIIDLTSITGKKLNMLRSMAKLEVIDKINYIDKINHKEGTDYDPAQGENNLRIAGVAINGVMKDALLLPTANQWIYPEFNETRQVQNATVTGLAGYAQPETEGSTLPFVYDARETERRKCPVYSCYVWEYSSTGIPEGKTPSLTVTVSNANAINPETAAPYPDVDYTLPLLTDMTPPADATPTPISEILRNTIHRYEISAVEAGLSVNWGVCPMDDAPTNITFN